MLYCKTLLLLLRCDTGEVRDRCGGMGWFKGRLRCEGRVNSVITNVITTIISCRYFLNISSLQYKNMYVHNKSIVSNY